MQVAHASIVGWAGAFSHHTVLFGACDTVGHDKDGSGQICLNMFEQSRVWMVPQMKLPSLWLSSQIFPSSCTHGHSRHHCPGPL